VHGHYFKLDKPPIDPNVFVFEPRLVAANVG
jgi:hypothetical protein